MTVSTDYYTYPEEEYGEYDCAYIRVAVSCPNAWESTTIQTTTPFPVCRIRAPGNGVFCMSEGITPFLLPLPGPPGRQTAASRRRG